MATETANDVQAHESTYSGFIAMLKWAVPLIVVISALVVLAIAS